MTTRRLLKHMSPFFKVSASVAEGNNGYYIWRIYDSPSNITIRYALLAWCLEENFPWHVGLYLLMGLLHAGCSRLMLNTRLTRNGSVIAMGRLHPTKPYFWLLWNHSKPSFSQFPHSMRVHWMLVGSLLPLILKMIWNRFFLTFAAYAHVTQSTCDPGFTGTPLVRLHGDTCVHVCRWKKNINVDREYRFQI